jgi:DNA-binding beta-propeller fold protein YncE
VGCAETGDDDDGAWDEGEPAGDDDDGPPAGDGDGDDDDSDDAEEGEDDFLGTEPRSTDAYVFIANPLRDTVTRVHAETRAITTIPVGDEPTMVLVSPDYQRAVTFDKGDDAVSVIDVATSEVTPLRVREDMNFVAMSPDGRWVAAWFDEDVEDADFSIDGVRSFTEVSFVDTVDKAVHSYAVGFNPKDVRFSAASDRAIVLSDTMITVAELAADPIELRLLDLGADPLDPPTAAEIEITPNGRYAFVRYADIDDVLLVDLDDGALQTLDAGVDPTDVDLSADGMSAFIVARGSNEVRVYSAIDPAGTAPTLFTTPEGNTLGSVLLSPSGDSALLYTTTALEDRVVFWDLVSGEMVVRRLAKPIRAAAISPDGASALILHTLEDAPGENDVFTSRWALTVVSLDTWLTNAVALQAEPNQWVNSNDGRYSMFSLRDNRNVGVIDYATRLVDDVLVPSVPMFVGMMPLETDPEDALGWVSQQHELGRISFIQPYDLAIETVTGFELNSEIE